MNSESARRRARAVRDGAEFAALESVVEAAAEVALEDDRSGLHVQSLARGLAVIRSFSADQPEMTLSEVSRETGLTRATARRFLHTLVDLGYVRTDGRRFRLRPRVLELGYSYMSSLSLPALAQPHLERLAAAVGESSSLSLLDGDDVVYLARVPTKRIMTILISVGTRFPAYATAMGRVLLAHAEPSWLDDYLARVELLALTERTVTDREQLRQILEGVRYDGFALVDQELESGLRSIAAPIRDGHGEVVAAMNISAPVTRGGTDEIIADLLAPLWQAAAALSADLAAGAG